jgi:hypothetical protein
VAFTRNVSDDLIPVCQANFRNLPESGVRLLGRAGHHLSADAATEGAFRKRWAFRFDLDLFAPFTDELVDRWHGNSEELSVLLWVGMELLPARLRGNVCIMDATLSLI